MPCMRPNEKFSFVAMSAHVADSIEELSLDEGLRVTRKIPLSFDDQWKNWMGSIRTKYLEQECTLFLYASMQSASAGILDGENIKLSGRVSRLLEALLMTGNFTMQKAPILATGAYDAYGPSLRSISDIVTPFVPGGLHYHEMTEAHLHEAFALMNAQREFEGLAQYDRIQRILYIFRYALRETNVHERLHQFCRCVEGLILADPGKTLSQFKSRTELFIGPQHHPTMGQLYDMRSRVEHMHDYERDPALLERDRRLFVMRMAALAEAIARYSLKHFLLSRQLWPFYTTRQALEDFWKKSAQERQSLWGQPADLAQLERDFDPTLLTDESLQLR